MPLLLALLACAPDPDPGPRALIDHAAWERLHPAEDPFGRGTCDPRGVQQEPGVIEILTDLCPWATLTQPALADGAPGDRLALLAYHGPLAAPEPATGHMALSLDGALVWEIQPPIPGDEGVHILEIEVERAWHIGAPVLLHVHNHGANAWRLATLERRRGE